MQCNGEYVMARIEYLDKLKKDINTSVKVFLTNGTMLTGNVRDHDDTSIVLDKCLIFIDQIISIVPQGK